MPIDIKNAKPTEAPENQEVMVTLKVRLSLPTNHEGEEITEEDIGQHVRDTLYDAFKEQVAYNQQEGWLDVVEIEQEADIYHPTQARAFDIAMTQYHLLGERLKALSETLDV